MELGMIGLGRMGANIVGKTVREADAETTPLRSPEAVKSLIAQTGNQRE
jgi:6-phosphogluconate dehydrogenase (decarboxylating)